MIKILFIDQGQCMSCGSCVELCPDVFCMNSDDIAEVINFENVTEESIQVAIEICPVRCIHSESFQSLDETKYIL